VVGAGGYDSDWDCELVVRVPDGLVYLGNRRAAGSNLFDVCMIFCLGCRGLRPYERKPAAPRALPGNEMMLACDAT
jgi:hypothetical protein